MTLKREYIFYCNQCDKEYRATCDLATSVVTPQDRILKIKKQVRQGPESSKVICLDPTDDLHFCDTDCVENWLDSEIQRLKSITVGIGSSVKNQPAGGE